MHGLPSAASMASARSGDETESGGKDNGAPGLRPRYHPDYYAAFVIGPDGHNIETVCHKPENRASRNVPMESEPARAKTAPPPCIAP
jgi:hypothetical protein